MDAKPPHSSDETSSAPPGHLSVSSNHANETAPAPSLHLLEHDAELAPGPTLPLQGLAMSTCTLSVLEVPLYWQHVPKPHYSKGFHPLISDYQIVRWISTPLILVL